jgi:hypothetical protein
VDHGTVDAVALSHSESNRQLGLREITGAAFHYARSDRAAVVDFDGRADRIPVGLRASEPEPDRAIPRVLVIPER